MSLHMPAFIQNAIHVCAGWYMQVWVQYQRMINFVCMWQNSIEAIVAGKVLL